MQSDFDIPLADAELSAVEDGLAAYEELLSKLADVPTLAGPTPRQLHREHLVQLGEESASGAADAPDIPILKQAKAEYAKLQQ